MTIEMMKAEAIAVDSMQVHILCPICREIHRHGSSGDIISITTALEYNIAPGQTDHKTANM